MCKASDIHNGLFNGNDKQVVPSSKEETNNNLHEIVLPKYKAIQKLRKALKIEHSLESEV